MIYKTTLLEAEKVFGENLQVGQKVFASTYIISIDNDEVIFSVDDFSNGEYYSFRDKDTYGDDFSISGGEIKDYDLVVDSYDLHFGPISICEISPEKMLTIVKDMVDYLKSNGHKLELSHKH